MAMLFCEGFEWLDNTETEANIEEALRFFWLNAELGSTPLATSRGSLYGANMTSTSDFILTRKLQQPDDDNTIICGFYMKTPNSWFNGGDIWRIICGHNVQCFFEVDSSNASLIFKRGSTTLWDSFVDDSFALTVNTEFYIEFKIVIHDSTGSLTFKAVDLTAAGDDDAATSVIATVSSLDTRNSGVTTETAWDAIQLIHGGLSGTTIYDDIYLCNSDGTDNNDFLGNVYIETLEPDGAGNSTQLTPSAGSNFQNVDELLPDDDTTYNTADADGETDLYTTTNPTETGDPFAVQVQAIARCTGDDRRTLRLPIRNNSVDSEGSDKVVLTNNYVGRSRILETDANGDAWTNALVNGLEIGFKRQANS